MDDSSYGLTAGVFSGDPARALGVLAKVRSGTAYVNVCDRVVPNLPWSGRRGSGVGATLGELGIAAFAHQRAFHIRA
jgi:acyl-CoA reductase-like NAD-dependent aldehyde dehydrogenase